jgi:hypothetical protein
MVGQAGSTPIFHRMSPGREGVLGLVWGVSQHPQTCVRDEGKKRAAGGWLALWGNWKYIFLVGFSKRVGSRQVWRVMEVFPIIR